MRNGFSLHLGHGFVMVLVVVFNELFRPISLLCLTPVKGRDITGYLDLIRLIPLLERTSGRPEIKIGLIDGPVVLQHPDLTTENVKEIPGEFASACALSSSVARRSALAAPC